jgi:hypothetical protein
MKMKALAFLCLVALQGHASAEEHPLSEDRIEQNPGGISYVIRGTEWSDFDGGTVRVEQRLSSDGPGRLIYRYDDQTEATKLYHQAFCDAMDMVPSLGEGVMEGPSAGWGCISTNPDALDTFGRPPKSADWVTATAPNGRVPVGVSYHSSGQMRMESSVGGRRQATIGVDNGRCTFTDIKHYAAPFRESSAIAVTCIVNEPRFVSTSMDVCIPTLCGSDRGTQFAE